MQTVQLSVFDRENNLLFYTLGMGVCFAAAKAAANVGMRARLAADRALARRVYIFEAEAI